MYKATETDSSLRKELQGYTYVPSYNAFYDLAKGNTVILWQEVKVYYAPGENTTTCLDQLTALAVTHGQSFKIDLSFVTIHQGSVPSERLIDQTQVSW